MATPAVCATGALGAPVSAPRRTETILARIDTATSPGAWEPIGIPAGTSIRSRRSSGTPASRSSASTPAPRFSLATRPT
jgi:hypothetical protein